MGKYLALEGRTASAQVGSRRCVTCALSCTCSASVLCTKPMLPLQPRLRLPLRRNTSEKRGIKDQSGVKRLGSYTWAHDNDMISLRLAPSTGIFSLGASRLRARRSERFEWKAKDREKRHHRYWRAG